MWGVQTENLVLVPSELYVDFKTAVMEHASVFAEWISNESRGLESWIFLVEISETPFDTIVSEFSPVAGRALFVHHFIISALAFGMTFTAARSNYMISLHLYIL